MKRNQTPPEGGADPGAKRSPRRSIRAAEFKAICLQLMDHVKKTGEEFVITKRNRPVAKLAPITDDNLRPFVGRSRGVIAATRADLLAPVGEDWEADADL